MGLKKPTLERLKEQNFEKLFLQSLKGSYLSFLENIFPPNLQEKPLSAYTEYVRDDRSFPNIGPMKKKNSQKIVIRHN
jgi:hypothetical protein